MRTARFGGTSGCRILFEVLHISYFLLKNKSGISIVTIMTDEEYILAVLEYKQIYTYHKSLYSLKTND